MSHRRCGCGAMSGSVKWDPARRIVRCYACGRTFQEETIDELRREVDRLNYVIDTAKRFLNDKG